MRSAPGYWFAIHGPLEYWLGAKIHYAHLLLIKMVGSHPRLWIEERFRRAACSASNAVPRANPSRNTTHRATTNFVAFREKQVDIKAAFTRPFAYPCCKRNARIALTMWQRPPQEAAVAAVFQGRLDKMMVWSNHVIWCSKPTVGTKGTNAPNTFVAEARSIKRLSSPRPIELKPRSSSSSFRKNVLLRAILWDVDGIFVRLVTDGV